MNLQLHEGVEQSRQGRNKLDVVDIFQTIQGEGPFSGERAVFIRTAGCNFECPDCDTDYTTGRKAMSYEEIWNKVKEKQALFSSANSDMLIVLTGGEPLRQDIGPFLNFLFNQRAKENVSLHVQIESNGTIYRNDIPWFAIGFSLVVSPKGGSIPEELIPHIYSFKYVIDANNVDPEDGLPLTHLGGIVRVARPPANFKKTVYIQPLDVSDKEQYDRNVQACVQSCLKFGYRMSLQLHKIINLP